jgi:hypothetical protein
MLSKKFLFTLVGLLLAIFAICKLDFSGPTIEGFWMTGQRGLQVSNYVKDPKTGQETAVSDYANLRPNLGSDKFVSVPHLQGILSPRMSNVDYGAHIRYNMPDYKNQAVPCNPLTFGGMAKENYQPGQVKENFQASSCGGGSCGGGCSPTCGKGGIGGNVNVGGGYALPSGFASGNYNQQMDKLRAESQYPTATNDLPIGTMTTMDAEGNVQQPVVYSRFMFARPQGRLRQYGDPIRGDLAIVPCGGNWFAVHPNISTDLQEGAMNVLTGVNNEQGKSLAALINKASGGADTTIAGVDLNNVNMGAQYDVNLSAALGDVNITAYP